MSYKVLYRKYRPDTFDGIVGQEYTISMLKNSIINNKTSHAYIFTGPRGTGKTSTAKIFSKALNCLDLKDGNPCNKCINCLSFADTPDVIELDAASNNSVDNIREIISTVNLVPTSMKYKIYIIDEVHMLSTGAFNALLLTLEEPPEHAIFILATTEIQKVPITILSRCQRFDFKPVNQQSMIDRLKYVSDLEKINITDDALSEIAMISAGGMRDALGMLDQLSTTSDNITIDYVSSYFGSVSDSVLDDVIDSISNNNTEKLIEIVSDVEHQGINYTIFIDKLIAKLRNEAINIKKGKSIKSITYEQVYSLIFDLNEMLSNLNLMINPYLLIEIVLMKYVKSDFNADNSNAKYFLGNNLEQSVVVKSEQNLIENRENYFPGNKIDRKNDNKSSKQENVNVSWEIINKDSNKIKIDVSVRINNCFVEASKDDKKAISSKWIDFMNYLMSYDRNVVSLLADTSVLAASSKYVLIQSKSVNTNSLINDSIDKIESYYKDYSGIMYKFAAVEDDLWKKEVENYRNNIKNKIKYSYIDEKIDESNSNGLEIVKSESDIEDVVKDIFDSYEIEN